MAIPPPPPSPLHLPPPPPSHSPLPRWYLIYLVVIATTFSHGDPVLLFGNGMAIIALSLYDATKP